MKILTNQFTITTKSRLFNPFSRQLISEKKYMNLQQISSKINHTHSAQRKWKKIYLQKRIQCVQSLVNIILNDQQKISPIISHQTGKSYRNIQKQYQYLKLLAPQLIDNAYQALQPIDTHNTRMVRQAIGLALIFPYFSEPIFDSIINLIPCLISGNGALIKPSDYNHFLGEYLSQITDYIPQMKNLVSEIFIKPDDLKSLADFQSIKKVAYSGSQINAKHIFETLVQNRFIDCNLFFGGKDAAFVDHTADISQAAKQITFHSFYNNGQSYDCIKRLYVQADVQQQLIKQMIGLTQNLKLGNPCDPSVDLGPLCNPETAFQFESLIIDAINEGACCQIGGIVDHDTLLCQPTIISSCSNDMPIIQTQFLAPLLCVISVEKNQNFLDYINQNTYGTGLRIFTQQPNQYLKQIHQIEVGRICFNEGSILNHNLPIEGWKSSGKGKLLSSMSYEEYTIPKVYRLSQ